MYDDIQTDNLKSHNLFYFNTSLVEYDRIYYIKYYKLIGSVSYYYYVRKERGCSCGCD